MTSKHMAKIEGLLKRYENDMYARFCDEYPGSIADEARSRQALKDAFKAIVDERDGGAELDRLRKIYEAYLDTEGKCADCKDTGWIHDPGYFDQASGTGEPPSDEPCHCPKGEEVYKRWKAKRSKCATCQDTKEVPAPEEGFYVGGFKGPTDPTERPRRIVPNKPCPECQGGDAS